MNVHGFKLGCDPSDISSLKCTECGERIMRRQRRRRLALLFGAVSIVLPVAGMSSILSRVVITNRSGSSNVVLSRGQILLEWQLDPSAGPLPGETAGLEITRLEWSYVLNYWWIGLTLWSAVISGNR